MPRRLRLAVAIVAVLLLTLSPGGPGNGSTPFFCLTCGGRVWADTLLNVVLFVPVGLAAASVTRRLLLALGIAVGLSLLVEVAQYQIVPGRDSSFRDILTNSLGGLTGVAILRWGPRLLAVPRRWAAVWSLVTIGWVAATILATGWLLEPTIRGARHYALWTTRIGDVEPYRGRILSAQIGDTPARGRLTRDVVRDLHEGVPLRVRAVLGDRRPRPGALIAVADQNGQSVMLVALERRSVVVRYQTRAMDLGFDQPDARFPGALRAGEPGDTIDLAVALTRPTGVSLELGGVPRHRRPSVSAGWTLLYNIDRVPRWIASVLGLCWVGLLVAPAGLWLRDRPEGVGAILSLGALLVLLPGAAGLRPTSVWEWVAAAAGVLGARWLAGRWAAP